MVDDDVAAAGRRRPAACRPTTRCCPSDDGASAAFIVVKRRVAGRRRDADPRPAGLRPEQRAGRWRSASTAPGAHRFGRGHHRERRQALRHRARQPGDLGAGDPERRSSAARARSPATSPIESANQLALLLNSGALPAPLKVIEQHTVGADLGADAVRAGGDRPGHRRGADLRLHHPGLWPLRRLRGHRPDREPADDVRRALA